MTANDLLTRARAALANLAPGEWRAWIRVVEVSPDWSSRIEVGDVDMIMHGDNAAEATMRTFVEAAPALVRDLVAELDAARAQVADATEVLRELVYDDFDAITLLDEDETERSCSFCGEVLMDTVPAPGGNLATRSHPHAPDCPVTRARRLLDGAG